MKCFFVLITSFILLFAPSLLSAELTILTENLPNLNYLENGELVGLSVDIVKEIQKRVGSQEQIRVFPWARAYSLALDEKNVVLFSITYTKARKDLFKWICPLITKRDILVAWKESGIVINSLEDAKNVKRVGTIRDDSKEQLLKSLGFTNLEPVSDEQKNAKKLMLGRIDLWVNKQPGLKTVCDLAEIDYSQLEEVFHLRKRDLCIAFSQKTSDSIVAKWKDAFNEMLTDGTIQQIRMRWNAE
jgi:polar amino acid transport system substrate-binding protein